MRILNFLIPVLTVAPWAAPHAQVPQQPSASDTELAIIAAAVDSLYMKSGAARVVVHSPTAAEMADDTGRHSAAPVDIRGFVKFVTSRIPVAFIDSGSLRTAPSSPDAFWTAFFAAYPGAKGIVTVSRPAISADGQHALLRIGMGCGSRCGSWGVAQLQRTGNRWHVTRFVVDRSA